ncbi:MAG TPA: hypothetical protein VM364_09320 [Vicinamibacterales bacterium]|nr:hypothetical protein [Vicinamibacterales bacterium]
MDFDPRDYDTSDDERGAKRRAKELAAPPIIAIVMTTGGNPTLGCATTMAATCEMRSSGDECE